MSINHKPKKLFECLAIASPSFCRDSDLVREAASLSKRIVQNQSEDRLNEDDLIKFLLDNDADALIIGRDFLTEKVIRSAPKLKAIGKYGVGLERIDLDAVKSAGIYFGFEPGVNRRSVSELTLGFMLGHQRNIFKSVEYMRQGRWLKDGGYQLSEKTVGIVGFGNIGTDLTELLKPLRCKILVHDILDKSKLATQLGAAQVTYDTLLERSDVISFHVPGGAETLNLFGADQIKITKPTALIINTSRGSVVDFEATTNAVLAGCLGGFASDVFPNEPLSSKAYSPEKCFYFTPHIGGNTKEAVYAMGKSAINGLLSYLNQP